MLQGCLCLGNRRQLRVLLIWGPQEGERLVFVIVQRFKLASQDDFEQFAWTIVFLAMGGIALGKGVTNSGLLETMDVVIRDLLEGFSLYTVVLILTPVVLVRTLRYRSYAMSRFSRGHFRLSQLSSAIR